MEYAVDEVIVKDDSIKFIVGVVKGFYAGKFFADSSKIAGIWSQGGMSLPFELRKLKKLRNQNVRRNQKNHFHI